MKKLIILFIITGLIISYPGCMKSKEKIIGMKIYEYNGDFQSLVVKWKKMGINTAFLSSELASDTMFRKILKQNKINVFLIFPVFQNPEVLKDDSTLYSITNKGKVAKDDWVEFVCPSRISYRNKKIAEAGDLVKNLNPEGLSIDFIRQFVFWEMIYPDRGAESIESACFCDSCLSGFLKRGNISIPDSCISTEQKAAFITNNYPENWNTFRCDLITSMAESITKSVKAENNEIKINIHAVPWKDDDFGGANIRVAAQDIKNISPFADYISPMCYSQMLKRSPEWISTVVNEMNRKAPGKILPSIQVYPYYVDDIFTPEDFRKCYEAAIKDPSEGVVFFSWPLFEKDTTRIEIIRQYF